MLYIRFVAGLLFLSALLWTAVSGQCAEQSIEQQISERMRQYQESLRQRAAQLSPSLQSKIESQSQQTVSKGLTAWKKGEVNIHIALPRLAEAQNFVRFIARHLPFSGFPGSSLEFGIGTADAALIVTTVQSILKSVWISSAHFTFLRSFTAYPSQKSGSISFFVQVVCTIIQRR